MALERPVIALIAEVVPASRGALVLSGDRSGDITSAVGWSRSGAADSPVRVSRPVVERVFKDDVGILAYDVRRAQCARREAALHGPRSVLAVPLVAFDTRIGAIVLEPDGPGERFDEDHLRLVMAIAGITATAFAHARQVDGLEDANRRLQAELKLDHNMVGESARSATSTAASPESRRPIRPC